MYFYHNYGKGSDYSFGAGIALDVNNLTVKNCTFDSNYDTGGSADGLAIGVRTGGNNIIIDNCNFINNNATSSGTCGGGAIQFYGTTNSIIKIPISQK